MKIDATFPICVRCGVNPCRWSAERGYSTQCRECNIAQAEGRRQASKRRKERQALERLDKLQRQT